MAQNLKNHARFAPPYHFILVPLVLIFIGAAAYNFSKAMRLDTGRLVAGLIFLSSLIIFLLTWLSRKFALMAQDRAIKAEEDIRHFSLTGKLLPKGLTVPQIVALRFASDNELEVLANKSAAEGLTSSAIKKEINNWREDNYRV